MVSLGDRGGTRRIAPSILATRAGWGAATHLNDDVPWGAMGFPSTNGWHHLVYTYDGNVTVKIYVDGLLWYTDTLGGVWPRPPAIPSTSAASALGRVGGPPGQHFSGYINAVRVWGAAMTASQVASNYLFGPWTSPASMPGPVVDNADGATNLAAGVAQLRGTLTNGPADVRLYWGTTDGGTNPANWANTILLAGTASGLLLAATSATCSTG